MTDAEVQFRIRFAASLRAVEACDAFGKSQHDGTFENLVRRVRDLQRSCGTAFSTVEEVATLVDDIADSRTLQRDADTVTITKLRARLFDLHKAIGRRGDHFPESRNEILKTAHGTLPTAE